jgi:hypothetical protein
MELIAGQPFHHPHQQGFQERNMDQDDQEEDLEMSQGRMKRIRSSGYDMDQLAMAQPPQTDTSFAPSFVAQHEHSSNNSHHRQQLSHFTPAQNTAAPPIPSFPAKLRQILNRAELSSIITWTADGQAWKIVKPREFEIRVIPLFFNHSKTSMFLREAMSWGFVRMDSYPGESFMHVPVFVNPNFQRDAPHLEYAMHQARPAAARR